MADNNAGNVNRPGPEESGSANQNSEKKKSQDKNGLRRSVVTHELEWRETLPGQHPGETYIRILRPHRRNFRRTAPGRLMATERVLEPKGWLGRLGVRIKRHLIGTPLSTAQLAHERLRKINALAVFSSDAVSSSAYATEEILLALMLAGTGALSLTLPIGIAISLLLAVVVSSYRQTILAYPQGGGTYIVAKDNLGTWPALVGASSLLFGYLLTVAVSVSAGVAAITSAFPVLHTQSVTLGVFFVILITVINLRGIKESGSIFAAPTYTFIVGMIILIAVGAYKVFFGGAEEIPQPAHVVAAGTETLSVFLIIRAFVSGCVGLTGTEAVADGVPAFKPPEAKNAVITLIWMGVILATLLIGVSFLATSFGIIPVEGETAVSLIARIVFGTGWAYYAFQVTTMLILILAANTAFADFPRLSYFLARDNFLPHQFQFRGDRLAFSTGIIVLGLLSCILIIIFQAETHALIPLYAVGVFASFTISQTSMIKRWWTRRERNWQIGMGMNGVGALVTGMVALVFTTTKFFAGAWVVLIVIPIFVLILKGINAHYRNVTQQLSLEGLDVEDLEGAREATRVQSGIIVPIRDLSENTQVLLDYAKSISGQVIPIYVGSDPEKRESLEEKWRQLIGVPSLIFPGAAKRFLVSPILAQLDSVRAKNPGSPVTVLIPKSVPSNLLGYIWQDLSIVSLRVALFFRPNTVVIDFPTDISRTVWKHTPVVIPVGDVNHATIRTVDFARNFSRNINAIHVAEDTVSGERLAEKWREWGCQVPLIVLESPYRSLVSPLLAYIDAIGTADHDEPITVVLSEFVPKHWWEFILHNQSALRLRISLFYRRNVIVVHFPYHLGK